MAKRRTSRNGGSLYPEAAPLRFDQRLVLLQWLLWLFDKKAFEQLVEPLKALELEGLNEDNNHKFVAAMKALWEFKEFPGDILLGYDQNIVRHTLAINQRRDVPVRWKYFQWLSLLFAEIYLDRFFSDPEKLLADLNNFVSDFNKDKVEADRIPAYEADDLRKLAFWNATGSGKTLLMHINILQYRHYLKLHGREKELNRIILLTPPTKGYPVSIFASSRYREWTPIYSRRKPLHCLPGRRLRSSRSRSCGRTWAKRPWPLTPLSPITSCSLTKGTVVPVARSLASG